MKRPALADLSRFAVRDVSGTSLDEWLALMGDPPEETIFVRNMFPSDRHRDEFLSTLRGREESQVKMVLRHFLISTGSNPLDMINATGLVADLSGHGTWKPPPSEHNRRLLFHHASGGGYPVWEGIGWVLDLLPRQPRKALEVLDAFLTVHFQHLTDNYLSGLFDAMALVRQRYIADPALGPSADAAIESLSWRELELLCGVLFAHMGYNVVVTPPSGDKGADVIVTRDSPGKRERVVVQAKKYGPKKPIERDHLLHLIGAIDTHRATRGVLVATGPVRRGAWALQKEDQRVDIINRPRLVTLLSEHCGADWPTRIDRLIKMFLGPGGE